MCNEVFSIDLDMDNLDSSIVLDNVQWKVVRQYNNNDFKSTFYNENTTVNLLLILEMLPEMCLICAIKCFPSIFLGNTNHINILRQSSMEVCERIEK